MQSKSDHGPEDISSGIIICSDRASSGKYEDQSGPLLLQMLGDWHLHPRDKILIPDDADKLSQAVLNMVETVDLIVIAGGTGIGPRDITPQTLDRICDYHVPGFGEKMRHAGAAFTPYSWLSRCGAWTKEKTLILALSGGPKAVKEQLGSVKDLLPHALAILLASHSGEH